MNHKDSHCAHFISHVLNLDFGRTCTNLTRHRKNSKNIDGANVSVKQIFDRCSQVYEVLELNSCPAKIIGLIFVSAEKHFLGQPSTFLGPLSPVEASPFTFVGTHQPQVCSATNFMGTPKKVKKLPTIRGGVENKHMGIIYNGTIWHYSNTQRKVIVQNMGQFINHYRQQKNALWFGGIPAEANPHPWATCVQPPAVI